MTPDLIGPRTTRASGPGLAPSGRRPYAGGIVAHRMLFWPTVPASAGMADFLFQIAATDIAGNRVTFAMPLLFVGKTANEHAVRGPSEAR